MAGNGTSLRLSGFIHSKYLLRYCWQCICTLGRLVGSGKPIMLSDFAKLFIYKTLYTVR